MKFYIGQRVRIVRDDELPAFVGKEGAIAAQASDTMYDVLVDGYPPSEDFPDEGSDLGNGATYWAHEDDLEPIVPEGSRTIVTWESCPWMPEHLRELQEA